MTWTWLTWSKDSPPGIHGDEVVGRELVLYLARALCTQFGSDAAITELVSTTEIHLLPSLNTDGYILKTRNNANDKVGTASWSTPNLYLRKF